MAAVLWTTAHVQADPILHEVALFVHLGCLIVGFGAVIAVDWMALLWVLGRRSLTEVLDLAGCVHVPIWSVTPVSCCSGCCSHRTWPAP